MQKHVLYDVHCGQYTNLINLKNSWKCKTSQMQRVFYLKCVIIITSLRCFFTQNVPAEPQVPVSSIRLMWPPYDALHDKWPIPSSLRLHPLWLCIIDYYRLKALSHSRGEMKGCRQTFLPNEGLCPTSCNLAIPQTAPSLKKTTNPLTRLPLLLRFKAGY